MAHSCSFHAAHAASLPSAPPNRLSALRATLEAEGHTQGNIAVFEVTRHRHPALTPHASPSSILTMLADRSSDRNAAKDALTRALLCEYHQSRHPLWAGLLILAYLPMMGRLCGRLRREGVPKDELWQLAILAFLETIAGISRDRKWICLSLQRDTSRRAFNHLGRERWHQRLVSPTAPDALRRLEGRAVAGGLIGGSLWPETRPTAGTRRLETDERDACATYLFERAGHILDSESLALVTTTLAYQQRIMDYVAQRNPHFDDVERKREYQRVKRKHSRAMARLRLLLRVRWDLMRSADPETSWVAATAA